MIRLLLLGALAGARSMTPLAAVTIAASQRGLPRDNGAPSLLGHPLVVAGATALAIGELAGDKWPKAPDRIVLRGLAARITTGAIAGAALAQRDKRYLGAALAAASAVAFSFASFAARMRSMRRFSQLSTGLIEDALIIAGTVAIVGGARKAAA